MQPYEEPDAPSWKSVVNAGAVLMLLCGSISMALMAFEQMQMHALDIRTKETHAYVVAIHHALALVNRSMKLQSQSLAEISRTLERLHDKRLFTDPPPFARDADQGHRRSDRRAAS
jgi:hypothetical protein